MNQVTDPEGLTHQDLAKIRRGQPPCYGSRQGSFPQFHNADLIGWFSQGLDGSHERNVAPFR